MDAKRCQWAARLSKTNLKLEEPRASLSQSEYFYGISGEQLAPNLFRRRQPPHRGDRLGTLAGRAQTFMIAAITAVNEFVLVTLQEIAGMVLVAC